MTLLFLFVSTFAAITISLADNPCNPRYIQGESVVCVCNFTYCDDLVRDEPAKGTFITYTSSKDGLRFKKKVGFVQKSKTTLEDQDPESECREDLHHMRVELDTRFQSIEGFGGAVTDAAGINWLKLTDDFLRAQLIESYFGSSGIEYTFIRTPIGGCDFSTRPYAFNELPENDTLLTNFTLAPEDFQYKIPMIQACMKAASAPVKVVATTWSPPRWMKTRDAWGGYSRLRPQYLQTYADYHLKFIEKYAEQGIPIWAITTTNEPMNGLVPLLKINSMGWTPGLMGKYIAEHLGPTIRNSSFNSTKILAVDDQRYTIPFWFNRAASDHPEVLKYVDGVGVHWYGDFLTPAAVLKEVYKKHPDKFLLGTEASAGYLPYDKSVILGSWRRAEDYVSNIIENLNHMYVGWIDWNLCLDPAGGPNWIRNNVDSAIIVNSNGTEFLKQPMFYGIGHFSKFLPPGSRRVEARVAGCGLEGVAFLTPRNTIVAVLLNRGKARRLLLQIEDKEAALSLEAKSFTTVEMSQEDA